MTLHIRNVSKTYSNGVQALKDVTLTIPAGMYGLRGSNGSGKSTGTSGFGHRSRACDLRRRD